MKRKFSKLAAILLMLINPVASHLENLDVGYIEVTTVETASTTIRRTVLCIGASDCG